MTVDDTKMIGDRKRGSWSTKVWGGALVSY